MERHESDGGLEESELTGVIDRWKLFFRLLLSPTAVVGIALVIGLGYLSTLSLTSTGTLIVSLLLTLFSGIVGGILADRWNNYMRRTREELRVVHLIRELVILHNAVERINQLLDGIESDDSTERSIGLQVKRIEDTVTTAHDVIESIINYWSGFLPSGNAVEILENIEELHEQRAEVSEEIEALQTELEEARQRAEEKAERERELESELAEKRGELVTIHEAMSDEEEDLNDVLNFGTPEVVESDITAFTADEVTCPECANSRDPNEMADEGLCIYCKQRTDGHDRGGMPEG